MTNIRNLTLSVRGILFPQPKEEDKKKWFIPKPDTSLYPPYHSRILVFDTETTIDKYQNLLFGQAWLIVSKTGKPVEESEDSELQITRYLFVHDEISSIYPDWPHASKLIGEHVQKHNDYEYCPSSINTESPFWPVSIFKKEIFIPEMAVKTAIVGFNLPFDISRISVNATITKDEEEFRFHLLGPEKSGYYPTITVKPLDSKKAFIKLSTGGTRNTLERYQGLGHNGLFIDLRTAIFALTNESHSLYSATHKLFPSEHAKTSANDEHGSITLDYLEYNRQDVHATYELYRNVMNHYKTLHPQLVKDNRQIEQLYSPASVGKAYFRSMGVTPFLKKNPDFPKSILGYAMSSFYAGRTETHLRNMIIQTCHVDLHSQYPSVFVLADLWKLVIAQNIRYYDDTKKMKKWISQVTLEDMLKPENWKKISGICKVKPHDDWLPVRANYASNIANIGWNYLKSSTSLWYTVADVIASTLKTGKAPKIEEVIMFEGTEPENLSPIKTIGGTEIVDYRTHDLFKDTIEKRTAKKKERDTFDEESPEYTFLEAVQLGLKIFANSTSYGINVELNEEQREDEYELYGLTEGTSPNESWEKPGPFFNPILATLITGNAHLLIYLAQALTERYGGDYAVMDTDSLFIVDREDIGKPVSQQRGNPEKIADKVIEALKPLYPYDDNPDMMLLEKEKDNDKAKKQGSPLYVFSVSSKRYVTFALTEGKMNLLSDKEDIVIDAKTHGLAYIAPHDEQGNEVKNWREDVWSYIIQSHLQAERNWQAEVEKLALAWEKEYGFPMPETEREKASHPPLPAWEKEAIRIKYHISTPFYFKQLRKHNGLPSLVGGNVDYRHMVKPYNFMTLGIMRKDLIFGMRPVITEVYCQKYHTIANGCTHKERCHFKDTCLANQAYKPVSLDDGKTWLDLFSGNEIDDAKLKTYGNIFLEHDKHPETKFDSQRGVKCGRDTIGLLSPTHVVANKGIKHIGKEMPRLEEELSVLDEVASTDKEMESQREYKVSGNGEKTGNSHEAPGGQGQLENRRSQEYWNTVRKELNKALKDTSLRKLAKEIGMSPASLSLFLHKKTTFDKSNEEKVLAYRDKHKDKKPDQGRVTLNNASEEYGPNLLNCQDVGKVYNAFAKFPDKEVREALQVRYPKQFKEVNSALLVIMNEELESVAKKEEQARKESAIKEALAILQAGNVTAGYGESAKSIPYTDIVSLKIYEINGGKYNPKHMKVYTFSNPLGFPIQKKGNEIWFKLGFIPTMAKVREYLKSMNLYVTDRLVNEKGAVTFLHKEKIDSHLLTGIGKRSLASFLGVKTSELPDKKVFSPQDVMDIMEKHVTSECQQASVNECQPEAKEGVLIEQ